MLLERISMLRLLGDDDDHTKTDEVGPELGRVPAPDRGTNEVVVVEPRTPAQNAETSITRVGSMSAQKRKVTKP